MLQYKNNKNVHFIVVSISLKGFSLKIRNALKNFQCILFYGKSLVERKVPLEMFLVGLIIKKLGKYTNYVVTYYLS